MCIDFGVIASLQHLAEEFDDRLATGYTPRPQKKKHNKNRERTRRNSGEMSRTIQQKNSGYVEMKNGDRIMGVNV